MRRAEEPSFLTPDTRQVFIQLRQTFTKTPILQYFKPERHIRIKTDVFSYAISGALSLITSEMGQWHLVAYYLQKIIQAKIHYETHNTKLLAIVKAFKNWCHYLESGQYKVLLLTNYNNLRQFIDTKSLSSRQVHWAQELSCYSFCINHCQSKANRVADVLFHYFQWSQGKEEIL